MGEGGPAEPPPSESHGPALTLEFLLRPEDLPTLTRLPGITRAAPSRPVRLLWHDDDDQSLAAAGLALRCDGTSWEIERLAPDEHGDWPACSPAPILSRAADPADLSPSVALDVAPVSAFEGRARAYRAGDVELAVLHGGVRGVVETRPACRVALTGPADALARLLPTLRALGLAVPQSSLAREALSAARGTDLPARHRGAPSVGADTSVGDGLAAILSHLLDVLLFWTDTYRRGRDPEPVHQARVATRRLRSALSIYAPVAPCPELADAAAAIKHCASILGAARDWDVFLAGAGATLAEVSERDPRVVLLLRAAARRRDLAHDALSAYLASTEFGALALALGTAAVLRPWDRGADPALHAPTGPFAAAVLARRLKHVRRRGRGIDTLAIPALHELRKDCKRLRYAAEFFAPGFPAKRTKPFLRRLSALQEELGALNDSASASLLLAQLGRAGRGYAGGMAAGMAAATARPARAGIARRWKRFKAEEPFWR